MAKMMKPEAEIIRFGGIDVIATSGDPGVNPPVGTSRVTSGTYSVFFGEELEADGTPSFTGSEFYSIYIDNGKRSYVSMDKADSYAWYNNGSWYAAPFDNGFSNQSFYVGDSTGDGSYDQFISDGRFNLQ